MTLYQMKQQLAELGAELESVNGDVRSKAGDPGVNIEEVRSLKEKQGTLQERYNILKSEIQQEEERQKQKLEAQQKRENPLHGVEGKEQRMIAAKAEFYRSAILGKPVSDETRNLLAGIPASDASGGSKLLPTNMSKELVHEPFVRNPLREIIRITQVTGLEVPKIAYELDDDDFITDKDTAKEVELTGDKVSFGRHKLKVKARVSDTVFHGSDLDLVNYIENALRSGLAAKEKKVSFATEPKTGEEHMSYYASGIKGVEGADLYEAITNAIADLHEDFRENARVVMRYSDYVTMLKTLANNSMTLYQVQPEQIIGKPVTFSDAAVTPIIGDFNYSHLNYDIKTIYDTDKDVDAGEYKFVLTAWIDQHHLLKSAFRLAEVKKA